MAFPSEFLDRLKSSNPIAEVMGEYVSAKRSGRDYICLCPFHNEKTPSCYIHPDREYFHCFGCGAGGDVITFIMKYHNLSYYEAVKYLAERAGLDMPADSYGSGVRTDVKKRIYEANRDAAKFFYSNLSKPQGRECVRYLMQVRGLSKQTITRYGMGFAPDSWSELKTHMLGLGYSERELLDARLISRSKNNTKRSFDFFVNRAVFPFIDLTGNILGFGGRTLGGDKRKYVNTPESAVYKKKRFLFSLNIAKNAAASEKRILLCEGNLDVITLVQAGFENAVASCGTALTPEQAKLISSYVKEVVICYDSDEAGQKAAAKAIPILESAGLVVSVISMKGAKDPDEYVKKFGAAAFEKLLDRANGSTAFRLTGAKGELDIKTDSGWSEYKDSAVKILASLDSAAERDKQTRKLSEELGVSYESLKTDVDIAIRKKIYAKKKKDRQDTLRFADRRDDMNPQAFSHFGEANAEEMIISYLYYNPDFYGYLKEKLPAGKFVTELNRRIYGFLTEAIENMTDFSAASMNERFTPEEMGRITRILERSRNEGINEAVARDCVTRLSEYSPKESIGDTSDSGFSEWVDGLRRKKKRN